MAVAKAKKAADTWKTKRKYEIHAPKMFDEAIIGETFASDEGGLIGRTITVGLPELIGDSTKGHIRLTFKVREVKGTRAETEFAGYHIVQEYIRSLMRRKTAKIEAVMDVFTKDNVRLRLKALAAGFGNVQRAQKSSIRKRMSELLLSRGKEMNLDELIKNAVSGKITGEMHRECNKIYPIKRLEIRKIELL